VNIFVGNLSFTVREDDLYKIFSGYGRVEKAVIVMDKNGRKSRGFGFVLMPDEEAARAAISGLNGQEVLGRKVNVAAAKNADAPGPGSREVSFKRTGRYKQGRRSISYMKKRGLAVPPVERKFKANPMRWRKKPKWPGHSQRPQEDAKPWEKPEGSQSKPWRKPGGETTPRQNRGNKSKPWEKPAGGFKPWRKGGAASRKRHSKKANLSGHKR